MDRMKVIQRSILIRIKKENRLRYRTNEHKWRTVNRIVHIVLNHSLRNVFIDLEKNNLCFCADMLTFECVHSIFSTYASLSFLMLIESCTCFFSPLFLSLLHNATIDFT